MSYLFWYFFVAILNLSWMIAGKTWISLQQVRLTYIVSISKISSTICQFSYLVDSNPFYVLLDIKFLSFVSGSYHTTLTKCELAVFIYPWREPHGKMFVIINMMIVLLRRWFYVSVHDLPIRRQTSEPLRYGGFVPIVIGMFIFPSRQCPQQFRSFVLFLFEMTKNTDDKVAKAQSYECYKKPNCNKIRSNRFIPLYQPVLRALCIVMLPLITKQRVDISIYLK